MTKEIENPLNRRTFLISGGVFLGCLIEPVLKGILSDYYQQNKNYYGDKAAISRDENGIFAEFRGNTFRIGKEPLTGSGLDDMLYRLNNKYNPDLRIKGDRLAILKDLFTILHSEPMPDLRIGDRILIDYKSIPIGNLQKEKSYYFPVYASSK